MLVITCIAIGAPYIIVMQYVLTNSICWLLLSSLLLLLFATGYVVDVMIQLANAVQYLHYHDIVHGVVHPCNMVLSSLNGTRVVLTDFSQARQKDSTRPVSSIYTEFLGMFV